MAWSFPIARLFGSEVRIHITFFLLLLWIGIAGYAQGGPAAAVSSIIFIIAIFACVVAHEFGHVLVARRFGYKTPDITLLPIGGMARLEAMPEEPRQEILVALAGPAVNVVIAGILVVFLGARPDAQALGALADPEVSFLARLASVNLFLAIFNLIPAFPMDGGRVLRAALAIIYPRARATAIAATAGQGVAIMFGFLGLLSGNVLLVFIAIFIYMAAAGESAQVSMTEVARSMGVREGMITVFESLKPGATLGDAADALIRTTQHEFPVTDNDGHLAGFLTREALAVALAKGDRTTPVASVMIRDVPVVRDTEQLDAALKKMQGGSAPAAGVVGRDGTLVGYVTFDNLGELMMIREAGA